MLDTALVALPDGRRFLTISMMPRDLMTCGEDFGIKVWDVNTGQELGGIKGHGDPITAFALTPDCRQVVTGDSRGMIRVWDIDRLEPMGDADSSPEYIFSLEISQDCRHIVATDGGLQTIIIDPETGRMIKGVRPSPLIRERMPCLGNGKWTITWANDDRTLRVVYERSGETIARFIFPEDIGCVDARGYLLAVGGSGIGNVYILRLEGVELE